jgi:hypothetical protein
MDWKSAGAELPPEWNAAVSAHNRELLGKRGLGRYSWCLAAEVILCLSREKLRELAAKLRDEAERDPQAFAERWSNRESAVRAVAPGLRAALNEALKDAERSARSKKPL